MPNNAFEQLADSKTIALAYAAQLRGGQAPRIMCQPKEMAGFLEIIAHQIGEALEAYSEAPLCAPPQAKQTQQALHVHEAAPSYK